MRSFIITYLLFTSLIFANISIENNEIKFKDFEVNYYIDESKNMKFQEIKNQKFLKGKNQKSFSNGDTHLWVKIQINNKSSQKQRLFLHHNNAYRLKYLKFYETQNHKLLNSFEINLSDTNQSKKMYGTDALYKFMLQPNETKIIYIQANSFIYQYYSIMVFNEQYSTQYLASGHLAIIIFLSILAGLMFYHFILYLITFFKDYLYYSLYLFFNILWGSYEYGLMGKYLGWYGAKYFIFDLMIIFSIVFLTLFIKNVLQMPKLYPKENKLANIILLLHVFNFSYIFIDIYTTLYLFSIVATFSVTLYLYIIISLYCKKDPYITYIIFAQIWFIIFNFITLFFYEGLIDYNFLTRYAYILGILLDTFAFSYLLSHRIKLLQEENKKNKEQTRRIQALSELLENISHQWRQPLTRINSSIMRISIELKKNRIHNNQIDSKLNDIENLSVYLSKTIDDFKSLYSKDRNSSQFNLKEAIEVSLELIQEEYQKNTIKVSLEVPKNIYINGYLNEFQQVLQVIFNNAQDALIAHQTENPQLSIFAEKRGNNVLLQIFNNGGEIDEKIINKIFDAHFSTKQESEGIGLFMSQKILKELMDTSLSCHNIMGGVCFQIEFQN
ncbi:MAG: Histidine kinase [uncultured Sulfurovum sp.]|uniref:histidine kinase n=1 Tax=uncultured Sulfurovum sp. TaxID=269237 RepID=A0A6S6TT24_9BACT|nr:MAG: Histidine kinase [uncultured Sulfurovum sp.]